MRGRRCTFWWSRAAKWLIAAWSVVALVTPIALPTMVARAAPAVAMPCDVAMHDPVHDPVHGSVHGTPQAHGHQRARDHGNDHACCTCFGPCCHAAPAVFARAPEAPQVAVALVLPYAPTPAFSVRYHPTAPEHARPPSVGPPVGLPV